MNTTKEVLVTGGAGFIGSNISQNLLNEGVDVLCVDNLITGTKSNIRTLSSRERFEFVQLDITQDDFLGLAADRHFDEIYHLACPTGVPNIKIYGEEMLRTCSTGTDNVLRIAREHGAKVVYTSSAEVYGDPEVSPQHEAYTGNVDPIGPRSAYEEGKRFSEALVKMYVDKYHVDAKIVRIFNTFGTGMSTEDTRVIPGFLQSIKFGRKVTIYGTGMQTRTHMYIDDLVDGLKLVMQSGKAGEAYNIGGQHEVMISQLFDTIRSLVQYDVEVRYEPHFIDDHWNRRPQVDKIRELGWKQKVSIVDGLKRMLREYEIPIRDDMQVALDNYLEKFTFVSTTDLSMDSGRRRDIR